MELKVCKFINRFGTETIISIKKVGNKWGYIAVNGAIGYYYSSVAIAKLDIKELFGDEEGFELLC